MNPLHVIGLCELRHRNVPLPRRKTVWFPNNALVDNRPQDKTILTHEQQYQAPLDTRLGVGVPPYNSSPTPEGGTNYVYSEQGGEWFGVDPLFSVYECVYIVAEYADPRDRITVYGFAPDPHLPRKFLLNYGPDPIHFGGKDYSAEPPGQIRGDLIVILPGEGLRIFWDHVDNCWRPIQRLPFRLADEGGMPAGQIVIQGRPVLIQGRPLVNTVPPLAARARKPTPATAKPAVQPVAAEAPKPEVVIATIVERARPLPRAPEPRQLPRAGAEPIELETTFADASLSMTEAGDKFRVSLARFAFTLRTTSVDNTNFEEVGVLRFDATRFGGTLQLVAELEVSAQAQSCELQLYDLTAASVVATLTTTSLVTQKLSTPVTLPLADHLYSVRLRRIGGMPTERVSCRSVHFQV